MYIFESRRNETGNWVKSHDCKNEFAFSETKRGKYREMVCVNHIIGAEHSYNRMIFMSLYRTGFFIKYPSCIMYPPSHDIKLYYHFYMVFRKKTFNN